MRDCIDSKTEKSLHFLEVVEKKDTQAARHILSVQISKSSRIQQGSERPICHGHITIEVHYLSGLNKQIGKQICLMEGYVDSVNNMARLPNGNIAIESPALRGLGLGSYLFNIVVTWVLDFGMDFDIVPVRFFSGKIYPSNLAQRIRFYEKFGFRFDRQVEDDAVQRHSRSLPMKASELVPLAKPPQALYPQPMAWLVNQFDLSSLPPDEAGSAQERSRPRMNRMMASKPRLHVRLLERVLFWSLVPIIFGLGFFLGKILDHF